MTTPTTARAVRVARLLPLAMFAALAAGCFTHSVESKPIEIKPIHITMDINLRVQKELENFFDFEDTASTATGKADGTQQGKE